MNEQEEKKRKRSSLVTSKKCKGEKKGDKVENAKTQQVVTFVKLVSKTVHRLFNGHHLNFCIYFFLCLNSILEIIKMDAIR